MMDTSKLIKPCPKCHTNIKPERVATTSTKILAGVTGGAGVAVGFGLGGPIGAAIGGILGYFVNKATIMSIQDSHNQSQWFKYKCPNCGKEWKASIHTNDHPDDISTLGHAPY